MVDIGLCCLANANALHIAFTKIPEKELYRTLVLNIIYW